MGVSYRGSIAYMTVEKLSLSFDKELARRARAAAAAEGLSLSAFVSRIVERRMRMEALKEFVEEYQAEHGAFTEDEKAVARALWPR